MIKIEYTYFGKDNRKDGYNIVAIDDSGNPIIKTWTAGKQDAFHKADIFADYYRDENGQRSNIVDETIKE